ncbi:hypothetical protein AVJ24_09640 [Yersinia pestis]|nr:hypothetical protein AVJ24_09640 [Yersinia pestis]
MTNMEATIEITGGRNESKSKKSSARYYCLAAFYWVISSGYHGIRLKSSPFIREIIIVIF